MIDSKSELVKDIQRLTRNVERRATAIESREDLPQFGAESFRKFEKRVANKLDGKSLSSLSEKDLTTIYRDIRYLNDLKSLTIKGAEKARDIYIPVQEKLSVLSPDMRVKFWETYDKLVEQNALFDQYKYELFDSIIDSIYEGEGEEEIIRNIIDAYEESIEGYGTASKYMDAYDITLSPEENLKKAERMRKYDEKKSTILFTSKLKELHK